MKKKLLIGLLFFVLYSASLKIFGTGLRGGQPRDVTWFELLLSAPTAFVMCFYFAEIIDAKQSFSEIYISKSELLRYSIRIFSILLLGFLIYECILSIIFTQIRAFDYFNLQPYVSTDRFKSRLTSFLIMSIIFSVLAFNINNYFRKQNKSKH